MGLISVVGFSMLVLVASNIQEVSLDDRVVPSGLKTPDSMVVLFFLPLPAAAMSV